MKKFLTLIILLGLVPTVSAMLSSSKRHKTDFNQQLFNEMKSRGNVDKMLKLIEMIADVDIKDEVGRTALILAAGAGYTKVCLALIKKCADPNAIVVFDGRTALMWAVASGHTEIAQALIEKGADVDIKDGVGRTALMWAAVNGHTEIAQALIEKGADVNATGENIGWTALMWAVCYEHTKTCRIILSYAIILPEPLNEDCLLTILCMFNRFNVSKDMRYYILGKLPLESLIGLLMPCKKCPIPLKSGLVEKIKEHTREQLIPMMLKARERASEKLKNLLDPEKFSDNFGEELCSTIKKVVDDNRLYLYKPVIQADKKDAL